MGQYYLNQNLGNPKPLLWMEHNSPVVAVADLLRTVASRESFEVLSALASRPDYPRRLAARLRRRETHVSTRLRVLERAGLVDGDWARENGKNVRIYRLKTSTFTVSIGPRGYDIQSPGAEITREATASERVPSRRAIFGRGRELSMLSVPAYRLSMVVGLAGMGKTMVATEIAHRHGVERVFWHTFRRFDSVSRLLLSVASWLASLDSSRRQKFERANWDLGEAFDDVGDGLSQQRALIVLDDYQEVRDKGIHELVRHWQRILRNAKVVVLSRSRPPFDIDRTTQLITLDGLDSPSSDKFRQLNRMFGGHPLSLRLHAQQPDAIHGTAGGLAKNIGEEAFRSLDRESQLVVLALAAVRRPLRLDEIQSLVDVKNAELLLVILERRALVRRLEGRYDVHDVIREPLAELTRLQPEIHRRALEMCLSSPRPDSKLEALYHATQIADSATIGALLEADLLEDPDPLFNRGFVDVYLDVLKDLPVDRLSLREQALVHFGLADIFHLKARWTAADREFETAAALARRAADPRILAVIFRRWGDNRAMGGRVKQGLEALRRALRISEQLGWNSLKAEVLLEFQGVFDWFLGDSSKAKQYGQRALEEARRLGNRRLIRESTLFSSTWPKDWRRVTTQLRRRIRELRSLGQPRLLALHRFRLGEIACRCSRLMPSRRVSYANEALKCLRPALTVLEAFGYTKFAIVARSWCSFALFQAGRIGDAEREAQAVLAVEREIGRQAAGVLARRVLSAVLESRGDLVMARTFAGQAVKSARRSHPQELGIALLEQALLERKRRGSGMSQLPLRQAIEEISRHGFPDEIRYAHRQVRALGARFS